MLLAGAKCARRLWPWRHQFERRDRKCAPVLSNVRYESEHWSDGFSTDSRDTCHLKPHAGRKHCRPRLRCQRHAVGFTSVQCLQPRNTNLDAEPKSVRPANSSGRARRQAKIPKPWNYTPPTEPFSLVPWQAPGGVENAYKPPSTSTSSSSPDQLSHKLQNNLSTDHKLPPPSTPQTTQSTCLATAPAPLAAPDPAPAANAPAAPAAL